MPSPVCRAAAGRALSVIRITPPLSRRLSGMVARFVPGRKPGATIDRNRAAALALAPETGEKPFGFEQGDGG